MYSVLLEECLLILITVRFEWNFLVVAIIRWLHYVSILNLTSCLESKNLKFLTATISISG